MFLRGPPARLLTLKEPSDAITYRITADTYRLKEDLNA